MAQEMTNTLHRLDNLLLLIFPYNLLLRQVPSRSSRLTQETTYDLDCQHSRQTQHKKEADWRKLCLDAA